MSLYLEQIIRTNDFKNPKEGRIRFIGYIKSTQVSFFRLGMFIFCDVEGARKPSVLSPHLDPLLGLRDPWFKSR